jgi:hypothetical protein
MYRTLAVITLILGILTVGFASSSYIHLRQLTFSAGLINVLDHFDVRIMTVGMLENARSNSIVASVFCRQLESRVYLVFGLGLALLLFGGAMLLRPLNFPHEQSVGHGAAEDTI